MPHVARNDLTAEYLRRQVSYDSENGIFVRRYIEGRDHRKNRCAGLVTGTINGCGYLRICIDQVSYKAHRLAWLYHYGEWPKNTIDHINGDRTDNRIANLRDVPHALNQLNLKRHRAGHVPHPKPKKRTHRGSVHFAGRLNKWIAQISGNYLGVFIAEELGRRAIAEWLQDHQK